MASWKLDNDLASGYVTAAFMAGILGQVGCNEMAKWVINDGNCMICQDII
jgi:hypothetical protein